MLKDSDRDLVCMLRYFCKVDNYFQCSDENYSLNAAMIIQHTIVPMPTTFNKITGVSVCGVHTYQFSFSGQSGA